MDGVSSLDEVVFGMMTRYKFIEHLKTKGINIEKVVTSNDVNNNIKPLGYYYEKLYLPIYLQYHYNYQNLKLHQTKDINERTSIVYQEKKDNKKISALLDEDRMYKEDLIKYLEENKYNKDNLKAYMLRSILEEKENKNADIILFDDESKNLESVKAELLKKENSGYNFIPIQVNMKSKDIILYSSKIADVINLLKEEVSYDKHDPLFNKTIDAIENDFNQSLKNKKFPSCIKEFNELKNSLENMPDNIKDINFKELYHNKKKKIETDEARRKYRQTKDNLAKQIEEIKSIQETKKIGPIQESKQLDILFNQLNLIMDMVIDTPGQDHECL
jgi:hypothetical protein